MPFFDSLASVFGNIRPGAAPALHLGAFGKHPAWDDHLEDFGLETEALLGARQLLYVRGIGGAIDSAAWDNLPPEQVLPEFKHVFFWFGENDTVVGRLWSSSDRKGRKRYPMVVCVHLANFPDDAPFERILGALAKVEDECRALTSAESVNARLGRTREQLRGEVSGNVPPPLPSARRDIARALNLNGDGEELARIIYSIETQLSAFSAAKLSGKMPRLGPRMLDGCALSQHLRLPTAPAQPAATAVFWRDLISQILRSHPPLLFLQPLDQPWIDLIAGVPEPKLITCLRASSKAMPLAQEVPYNLPVGFREHARSTFAGFCAGEI